MLPPSLLAVFALAAFVAYRISRSDVWGPLSKIPGPFLARFTRLWEQAILIDGDFAYKHQALHRKYGPVVRLGPGKYSFSEPADAKIIYGHASKVAKTDFYTVFRPYGKNLHDIFTDQDPARHNMHKRRIANVYSMSSMRSLEHHVEGVTTEFIERLKAFAASHEPISMPKWLRYYAFDVIGRVTFSKAFGFIKAGKDHDGILEEIDIGNENPNYVAAIPEWYMRAGRISQFLGLPLKPGAFKNVQTWAENAVASKMADTSDLNSENTDIFNRLSALQKAGKLEQYEALNAVFGNIAAGSDTTGITLSSVVWNLAKNPTAKAKLQEEIRTFEAEGKISNPITFQEAITMPYLQAVIKEALRVHPATGLSMPRVVPKGGMQLNGQFFPEGTTVAVNPWVINYNKGWWGDDAYEFKPERWLGAHDKAAHLESAMYTFGAGNASCLGKNVALLELNKVIPQLYRNLDFELAGPTPERQVTARWFVQPEFTCKIKAL